MKNQFAAKKTVRLSAPIGVWGFGRVGKSVVNYLHTQGAQLTVLDNRELSPQEKQDLAEKHIPLLGQQDIPHFLETHAYIVPSPGIDLRPYSTYKNKWLSELDLFAQAWHKPYIAITGSVGKTTVTHVLGHLLHKSGVRVAVGGNIGNAMLNLVPHQDAVDLAVLEVSSFQLELCTHFAPDSALWTNFYPNHLDRHSSAGEYCDAKAVIFKHQRPGQYALAPLELAQQLARSPHGSGQLSFFSPTPPTATDWALLPCNSSLFFLRDNTVFYQTTGTNAQQIAQLSPDLLEITFAQNWLALCATLHLHGISCTALESWVADVSLPAHRLEKVATIAGIDFYNDSKATTPQSTLAAVHKLQERPILLFLGGLSKGIDRTDLIKMLPTAIKMVYCFGKEAPHLRALCQTYTIPAQEHPTLESAFSAATTAAQPGDQLLFSPAGSSFDLFANYEERGTYFKKLVEIHKAKI